MASLTPGVLLKLLQNLDNKEAKVAGEHRSALLQVIGIVPSLEDDPWKSRGFYLRVSDSQHSAYVSVSEENTELILSDKVQLGQFIYVTRLDSGSPVPVLQGLKPVPKRRPCVGEPTDLISSDFLNTRRRGDSKKLRKNGEVKKAELKVKTKGVVGTEEAKSRRLSVGPGKVENNDTRRLSLDSSRKGWEQSPGSRSGPKGFSKDKLKDMPLSSDSANANRRTSDKALIPKHPSSASSERDVISKGSISSMLPLESKNEILSPKSINKPVRKEPKTTSDESLVGHLSKVTLSFNNWSDSKLSWNLLPSHVHDLGKEVRSYRNVAFSSAVHALEEASAAEGVIRCMSMFAELCGSSQKDSSGIVVEQFLNLYESMQKAAAVVESLLRATHEVNRSTCSVPEMSRAFGNKNASSWVQAAMETDLSKFCLFTKEVEKGILSGDKCHYIIIENSSKKTEVENHSPKQKQSPRTQGSATPISKTSITTSRRTPSAKERINIQSEEWSKGEGLQSASNLAEKLLLSSRAWFLNYLEYVLKKQFEPSDEKSSSEIANLLGQLKRVNQWLDDSFQEGSGIDERIEGLKKSLYGFLLDNVDSAIMTGN